MRQINRAKGKRIVQKELKHFYGDDILMMEAEMVAIDKELDCFEQLLDELTSGLIELDLLLLEDGTADDGTFDEQMLPEIDEDPDEDPMMAGEDYLYLMENDIF